MKKKYAVIETKAVFKSVRKPVPKPSVVHKEKTSYNRKKNKTSIKKILKGGLDEENNI